MNCQIVHDPAALNRRLLLRNVVEIPDGLGGMETTHTPVAHVWATLQPLTALRREIALQNQEKTTHEITIRYRDDIASGWQFVLGQRVFRILTVHDPDERRNYLVCSTEEEGR